VVRKRFCKHCKVSIAGRSNKIFCSANCRKRSSEGNKNSFVSYEKKNHNMRLFDSATRIAEMYFQMSPFERLGLMREYIILARQGNGKMREVLSNEFLMDCKNDYGNPFRGKRGKSYGSLAQACETYCQYFWNASARDVVYKIVAEPEDGVTF
jgi:hypothetical protein